MEREREKGEREREREDIINPFSIPEGRIK
jgi:hypothetical protein